jgi:hypothetical protein
MLSSVRGLIFLVAHTDPVKYNQSLYPNVLFYTSEFVITMEKETRTQSIRVYRNL